MKRSRVKDDVVGLKQKCLELQRMSVNNGTEDNIEGLG